MADPARSAWGPCAQHAPGARTGTCSCSGLPVWGFAAAVIARSFTFFVICNDVLRLVRGFRH